MPVNCYYLEQPENLLGRMVFDESMYGNEDTALHNDDPNFDLESAVNRAIQGITKDQPQYSREDKEKVNESLKDVIPADPAVKNFTFTVVGDALFYRYNDEMQRQEYKDKQGARIRGMHAIRQALRAVIDLQANPYENAELETALGELNDVYDGFVRKFGHKRKGEPVGVCGRRGPPAAALH